MEQPYSRRLNKDGVAKGYGVHRLVAIAFRDNPDENRGEGTYEEARQLTKT